MSLVFHRNLASRRRRPVLLGWRENVAKTGVGLAKNPKGNITRYTDPVGRESRFVYGTGSAPDPDPAAGSGIDLLQVKHKNGSIDDLLWSATYNTQHLPLTTVDASGQTTTYTYNTQGQLLTVTTPPRAGITENRTTTYSYDANGFLQSVTPPATGAITSYGYDAYGRVRTITNADNYSLTFDYDALDRQTKTTYPDGTYEEIVYNRLDAEKQRDRLGRWNHTFFDALKRVASTRDALGRTVTQTWCTCGSLDKVTDVNANTTAWDRDVQGRVTKEIRANGTQWLYTYENTTSRLKQITDPKNQSRNYEYFLDDALRRITYTNAVYPTPTVTLTFDTAYRRLATMVDGAGTTKFSYNPISTPPLLGAGQLASVDGPGGSDTKTYGYDELGRQVSRTLDGLTTATGFDALHRVTTVTHPVGTFTYAYVGTTGRTASLSYPNGVTTTYAYLSGSNDRRLQEIHHKFPSTLTLAKLNYGYDSFGSIKTWTQQDEANPGTAYDFAYDAVDGLVQATYRTTDAVPITLKRYAYTYDAAGNRTTEQVDDAPLQSTYNNMNRLLSQQPAGALRFAGSTNEPATVTIQGKAASTTSDNKFSGSAQVAAGTNTVAVVATDPAGNTRTNTYQVSISGSTKSYTYDANGNLTQKVDGDTWGYEWYADDRLARVTKNSAEVARFVYDGFGRRYQKIAGGITTIYTYSGDDILREDLSSGTTYHYVNGPGIDEPLARRDQAGATIFYHSDQVGSIIKTTNTSAQVVTTRKYDPFGNLEVGATEAGYAFTGREWDPETNLYNYRARYYDSKIGAFISEDPVDYRDGLSRYAYVLGNPVNLVDPTGLTPEFPSCAPECPPRVKNGAENLCRNAGDIPNAPVRRCVQYRCRSRLPISCTHEVCDSDDPVFYGYTPPSGDRIVVCPNNVPPEGEPCMERVIAHEMMHTCRSDGPEYPPEDLSPEHETMTRQVRDAIKCPFPGGAK